MAKYDSLSFAGMKLAFPCFDSAPLRANCVCVLNLTRPDMSPGSAIDHEIGMPCIQGLCRCMRFVLQRLFSLPSVFSFKWLRERHLAPPLPCYFVLTYRPYILRLNRLLMYGETLTNTSPFARRRLAADDARRLDGNPRMTFR